MYELRLVLLVFREFEEIWSKRTTLKFFKFCLVFKDERVKTPKAWNRGIMLLDTSQSEQ